LRCVFILFFEWIEKKVVDVLWNLKGCRVLVSTTLYFKILKINIMFQKALHTEQIRSGKRTYFFDIKQTEKGASYLEISLVKKVDEEQYERNKILIFENQIEQFGEAFLRTLVNFKKTGREAMIEEARKKYPKAFTNWTKEDDQKLEVMYAEEKSVNEMALFFERNEGAIRSRIEKLQLPNKYIVAKSA